MVPARPRGDRPGVRAVGSEQNPDLTGKDVRAVLGRARPGPTGQVQAFLDRGEDFIVRDDLESLVGAMNRLAGEDWPGSSPPTR